ncbi:hypothetical protein D1007_14519 [Hordeum vulgare]|nr:hypothetical protein D1007_34759 [Hordeum vulgare]KAE8809077.1 hypothetical protein D1007_14519 [Hordeum vulgare]
MMKRLVAIVTPRKSPRLAGKVASPSLAFTPIGSNLSAKAKRCGVKRKGVSAKVNKGCKKRSRVDQYSLTARPMRRKRGPKPMEGATEGEVVVKCFNKTVRCSLKEVKVCANYLRPRHKARAVKSGFGCVFDLKIDSNISHPLIGHLYTNIDPSTMILDMGESNKKLRITSDSIRHLFGFPQGDSTPPKPSEDDFDVLVMRLKAKHRYKRSADNKKKEMRNILKGLMKDENNDDLALHAFYLILFMKLVIPRMSRRVSREATMAENLVSHDMSQMDYCLLLVGDLKRAIIRYQQGTTRGKDVTDYGISPLLMYLDCLIHGKQPIVDLRTPLINFMDQGKLCEIATADLVKKGDDDPAN